MSILSFANTSVDLQPFPINPEWVLHGNPIARRAEVSRSEDGMSATVVWDCSPGSFQWHYGWDETMCILEGDVVLDEGLPTERCIGAGDIVVFPAGSSAFWRVKSHVRKLAFLRKALPSRFVPLVNTLRDVKRLIRPPAGPSWETMSEREPVGANR